MREPALKKPTYEDVQALPDDVQGEIIDGELYVSPRPRPRHALTATRVVSAIDSHFDRDPGEPGAPGGWWFLFEPELHLEGCAPVIPDVAGWRYERLPDLPDEAFISTPPDWVCEILSPSTVLLDRWTKKQKYAQNAVSYIWLVDPAARSLETFSLAGDHYRETGVYQGDVRVRLEPFTALELDLSRWWRVRRG